MADSPTWTHAKVDGKPVRLDIDADCLKWAPVDSDESNAECETLPTKNIIAAIESSPRSVNEYKLLYAVKNATTEEGAKQSPLVFRSAVITDFPRSVVQSYAPRNSALWQRVSQAVQTVNVVISTGSGTGLATPVWDRLVQPCLEAIGVTTKHYTVHTTTSDNSVAELVQHTILPLANEGADQLIVLLSGDGGMVDIVNALVAGDRVSSYKRPTIALLPLGTGNALANSAVVGDDDTMGLRTLVLGSPKDLPLFRAVFTPGARLLVNEGNEERALHSASGGHPVAIGAVVCSWGLHAALVADSDTTEYRKFGAERFKMAANEALYPSDGSLPHAYRGRISILRPGKEHWEDVPREEHGYVLATLVSHLEAGFTISPHGQPLDGKLRLVNFGHVSGQEAMELMTKAYQGGAHVDDDRVGYEEINGLRIHFDEDAGRWRRVCVDGKIIRVEAGGWVEVRTELDSMVTMVVSR